VLSLGGEVVVVVVVVVAVPLFSRGALGTRVVELWHIFNFFFGWSVVVEMEMELQLQWLTLVLVLATIGKLFSC
tara:strand:- start:100 stop:321 length:222 start_codon:yes stop_codon:yes gene_type:complete